MRTVLRGGRSSAGTPIDVAVSDREGVIVDVGPTVAALEDDVVEDCAGMVVLAAPAEPHAHLDKALSGLQAPNPAGDLFGAIEAWHAYWPSLTHDDLVARATSAVEQMVLNGTTAIRSHTDIGVGVDLKAVEALISVRDAVRARGLADIQVVGLVAVPVTGPDGAPHRRLMEAALDLGIDVVGGMPYRNDAPEEATAYAISLATRYGVPVDLHTDESLDPSVLTVTTLAEMTVAEGLGGRVTASHCVSLGVQEAGVQEKVSLGLAAAGVAVVVLPQTNLYLQSRLLPTSPPRGLTAVRALIDAGATLAAGADNVRDPFCSMGRLDALETAALLVMTAHLTPAEAWGAVTTEARAAMGLPAVSLTVGSPAELLAVAGASLADAMATASQRRITVHQGRVVARTTVSHKLQG